VLSSVEEFSADASKSQLATEALVPDSAWLYVKKFGCLSNVEKIWYVGLAMFGRRDFSDICGICLFDGFDGRLHAGSVTKTPH